MLECTAGSGHSNSVKQEVGAGGGGGGGGGGGDAWPFFVLVLDRGVN